MPDDYCELCDLPKSTCVHGMPPAPPPPPPAPKAPRAPRAPRATTPRASTARAASTPAPAVPTRRAPRRWTPPEDLAPHILAALDAAGGELDTEDMFAALETRLADELLEGDRQLTPEGELRWRFAARRARQTLIQDGVMSKSGPGVWTLA